MQKLKNVIIDKLIEKQLSSYEFIFLFCLSHYQDKTGMVKGVYYKSICKECKISFQSFYNIKESLVKKKYIEIYRESDIDYDIQIQDNDFTGVDFKNLAEEDYYLNTAQNAFRGERFYRLKAKEKLLLILLMMNTQNAQKKRVIGYQEFYKKYTDILGVTERVLRMYLKSLKDFFHICLKDFKYYITPKEYIHQNDCKKSDDALMQENLVRMFCRREKIKEYTNKEVEDAAVLIGQYRAWAEDIVTLVKESLQESMKWLNQDQERNSRNRILKPKLIHKILKMKLGIE